ncbi:MAG: hypothetical protein QW728_05530, partial [Thermoplasmata archaeon]
TSLEKQEIQKDKIRQQQYLSPQYPSETTIRDKKASAGRSPSNVEYLGAVRIDEKGNVEPAMLPDPERDVSKPSLDSKPPRVLQKILENADARGVHPTMWETALNTMADDNRKDSNLNAMGRPVSGQEEKKSMDIEKAGPIKRAHIPARKDRLFAGGSTDIVEEQGILKSTPSASFSSPLIPSDKEKKTDAPQVVPPSIKQQGITDIDTTGLQIKTTEIGLKEHRRTEIDHLLSAANISPTPSGMTVKTEDAATSEDKNKKALMEEDSVQVPPSGAFPTLTSEANSESSMQTDKDAKVLPEKSQTMQPSKSPEEEREFCPACSRKITSSNESLQCSSCAVVACSSCFDYEKKHLKFHYPYDFYFETPLCKQCYERDFQIQKQIAYARSCFAACNFDYAMNYASNAIKIDPSSIYVSRAMEIIRAIEETKANLQKNDEQWQMRRKQLIAQMGARQDMATRLSLFDLSGPKISSGSISSGTISSGSRTPEKPSAGKISPAQASPTPSNRSLSQDENKISYGNMQNTPEENKRDDNKTVSKFLEDKRVYDDGKGKDISEKGKDKDFAAQTQTLSPVLPDVPKLVSEPPEIAHPDIDSFNKNSRTRKT